MVVTDAQGKPIERAQVLIERVDEKAEPFEGETDPMGQLEVRGLDPVGQYRLQAKAKGYRDSDVSALRFPGKGKKKVPVVLQAP